MKIKSHVNSLEYIRFVVVYYADCWDIRVYYEAPLEITKPTYTDNDIITLMLYVALV